MEALFLIIADVEQLARFKEQFGHFSDFFHLLAAIRTQNNTFSLHFKCQLCQSEKILKSHSKAPKSNLIKHMNTCHPEHSAQFFTPRGPNSSTLNKNIVNT